MKSKLQNVVRIITLICLFLVSWDGWAQADCMTGSGPASNFFNTCESGTSYTDPDDYEFRVNANKTMVINGDVNITGTLTIDLDGINSSLTILGSGSLNAANITFKGSASAGHIFIIDGSMVVTGTLDFNRLPIDIDGTGTLDAPNIIQADDVTCADDSDCPTVTYTTCDDGTDGTFCAEVLPVELSFFKSIVMEDALELRWQTVTEENNDIFTVERSKDAKNYETLGTVAGAGNSFETLNYSFVDTSPLLARSYYRLKQTDFDGNYEYFGPILVNWTNINSSKIAISPNPAQAGTAVELLTGAEEEEHYEVRILTLEGEEMSRSRQSGGRSIIFLEDNLSPGIYLLELSTANFKKHKRLHIK